MRTGWALVAAIVVACASAPQPTVLSELDAVQRSPAAEQAEKLAPQAYAHAAKLQAEAAAAHEDGETASSQILAEHALAAYAHAFVLARAVQAKKRAAEAEHALAQAKSELAQLDARQQALLAEAESLELRMKVARDAIPLTPSAPASAERDRARRAAIESLLSQARLLCAAAKLLEAESEPLTKAMSELESVAKEADSVPQAPIDRARAARSACLRVLSQARTAELRKAATSGQTDALLDKLSQAGHQPFRDDRGVVVTLRNVFLGANLSPEGKKALEELGATAKANPRFPLLVVAHSGRRGVNGMQHAERAAEVLRASGATQVSAHAEGIAQPVRDPKSAGAAERNTRLEVVFVSPGS